METRFLLSNCEHGDLSTSRCHQCAVGLLEVNATRYYGYSFHQACFKGMEEESARHRANERERHEQLRKEGKCIECGQLLNRWDKFLGREKHSQRCYN